MYMVGSIFFMSQILQYISPELVGTIVKCSEFKHNIHNKKQQLRVVRMKEIMENQYVKVKQIV